MAAGSAFAGAVSAPAPPAQAGAGMKRPPAAGDAASPASGPVAFVEVRGRVVDPQGRPVSGATVRQGWPAWLELEDPTVPDATSGADGRFVAADLAVGPECRRLDQRRRCDALDRRHGPRVRARHGPPASSVPTPRPS